MDSVVPRDAATLLVITGGANPKVLVGRRGLSARFMPGVYVFPGGVTEPGDSAAPVLSDVNLGYYAAMQVETKAHANALAVTALRETFEETGLLAGFSTNSAGADFQALIESGIYPDLAQLYYLGRAITPPVHTSRFHARFFVLELDEPQPVNSESDELEDIHWLSLSEKTELPVAPVTRFMLEECRRRAQNGFNHAQPSLNFRWVYGKPVATHE
jgi:8-oxo-dGTP pyrophosphatase MutT (NUDIX family)